MNKIKHIRELQKLTQENLAKQINMSKGNLSQIENGIVGITYDNLIKICAILKCSIAELFGEKEYNKDDDKNIHIKFYNQLFINDFTTLENVINFEIIAISEKLFGILNINNYKNIIAIKAFEKNMEPAISNNDFVLIDLEIKDVLNNKIYLIQENSKLKLKRIFRKNPNKTTIFIKSDLEIEGEYEMYELDIIADKEKIIGQVVFCGKSIF